MQKNCFCGRLARGGNRHIITSTEAGSGHTAKGFRAVTKTLLVMKLTIVLLTLGFLNVSAKGLSQNVTFSGEKVALKSVFLSVEKQTGFVFLYNEPVLKAAKAVSVSANGMLLEDFLKEIFKTQPLKYSIRGQSILIYPKPDFDRRPEPNETFYFLYNNPQMIVRGRVTDENGKPLEGVSVTEEGSKKGTSTNKYGAYELSNVNENGTIVFSFVGYESQSIPVNARSWINVSLKLSLQAQSEVVIIGYGSTTKRDLTGSVSTIDTKQIQDIPFNTVDNAMAGKAAGVQVTKSDGAPGGAVKIRIRGTTSLLGGNDPLYIIDGVPVEVRSNFISPGFDVTSTIGGNLTNVNSGLASTAGTALSSSFVNGLNSLNGLNPDDIETITILKDASSTAIYGSKAANGVVIITTKRGKKDMRPSISVNHNTTYTTPITPHLLNADQYREIMGEAAKNTADAYTAAGRNVPAKAKQILNNPGSYFGKSNTDWVREVTQSPVSTNDEITVQGGSSASKYFSSISYNNSPVVVKSTGYQRISGKLNMENEISRKFRFITNLLLGYTSQNIGDGAYGQALSARPDITPYNIEGNFMNFRDSQFVGTNPVALLTATNNAKTFNLIGSASGIYDVTKDLQFKSTVSLNMQTYNQRNFMPSYIILASKYSSLNAGGGIGSNSNSRFSNWFVENTLTYNKRFKKDHSVNMLVGTSYETKKYSFFSATGAGYPNNEVLTSLSSAMTPLIVTGDDPGKPQSYLLSFYVRANYSYRDKYLFTFTGRSDASSKFGTENKVGYFPSGAIAWRLSNENFLKNVGWIDEMKLRGSYGLTGTQNIGDQMYRTLYSPGSYNGASTIVPTQLGNNAIRWESTGQMDLGLDVALFNSRVSLTADYYDRRTSGALLSLPVPLSTSYSSLLQNAVDLKNTGLELALDGDIVRSRNFTWNAGVNITWNKSLVTKLNPDVDLTQIGSYSGLEVGNTTIIEGQPLGLIKGSRVLGIFKTQKELDDYKNTMGVYASFFPTLGIGDPMLQLDTISSQIYGGSFYDYDQIIAHAAPKFYGGFYQNFRYKNFSLGLSFTFSSGGKLVWGSHIPISNGNIGYGNQDVAILDRYTPENPNTGLPRILFNGMIISQTNLDIFSSSYLKLRSLLLNYQFNKSAWTEKIGIQGLSVFVSATNIFTITKYPGLDPETTNDTYSSIGGYSDVSNYPAAKTYSIGLKATF